MEGRAKRRPARLGEHGEVKICTLTPISVAPADRTSENETRHQAIQVWHESLRRRGMFSKKLLRGTKGHLRPVPAVALGSLLTRQYTVWTFSIHAYRSGMNRTDARTLPRARGRRRAPAHAGPGGAGPAPDQRKLGFALWNRQDVSQLIIARLGIQLPIRTVLDAVAHPGGIPRSTGNVAALCWRRPNRRKPAPHPEQAPSFRRGACRAGRGPGCAAAPNKG